MRKIGCNFNTEEEEERYQCKSSWASVNLFLFLYFNKEHAIKTGHKW